jgi:hypothetical protein
VKPRKSSRFKERFAALPLSVLMHSAFKTLPVGFQRVLWLLAAQYNGTNNGNLSLTRAQALLFGLNNERHRTYGLRALAARGLIEKTCQGGIAGGKRPTLWALAWKAIDFEEGQQREVVRPPPCGWLEWKEDGDVKATRVRAL